MQVNFSSLSVTTHKQAALDLERSNKGNVNLTYEHVTWFLGTFFLAISKTSTISCICIKSES